MDQGRLLLTKWRDREEELRADPTAVVTAYRAAVKDGSMPPLVWAGEGLDLITELVPAGELVRQIGAQAVEALAQTSR